MSFPRTSRWTGIYGLEITGLLKLYPLSLWALKPAAGALYTLSFFVFQYLFFLFLFSIAVKRTGRVEHGRHMQPVIRALLRTGAQDIQNGGCLAQHIYLFERSIHLKSVVGIAAIFRTSLSCYLTDILTLPLLTTPLSLFRFPSLCQQECFAFFLCVHSSSPNRKNKLMDSMSVYMHVTRWTQAPIIVNFNSQHRTALWSERKLLEQ